jgi:hypothetical protein
MATPVKAHVVRRTLEWPVIVNLVADRLESLPDGTLTTEQAAMLVSAAMPIGLLSFAANQWTRGVNAIVAAIGLFAAQFVTPRYLIRSLHASTQE